MRPEILFPLYAGRRVAPGGGATAAAAGGQGRGRAGARPAVPGALSASSSGRAARSPRCRRARSSPSGAASTRTCRRPRPGHPYRIRLYDETGYGYLAWFKGHGPHLARQHPVGAERITSGRAERFNIELQIIHPDFLVPPEREAEVPLREAVYPTTAGLPSRTLRRLALAALERAPELAEWIDPHLLAREGWPQWRAGACGAAYAGLGRRSAARRAGASPPRLRRAAGPPARHGPAQGRPSGRARAGDRPQRALPPGRGGAAPTA